MPQLVRMVSDFYTVKYDSLINMFEIRFNEVVEAKQTFHQYVCSDVLLNKFPFYKAFLQLNERLHIVSIEISVSEIYNIIILSCPWDGHFFF